MHFLCQYYLTLDTTMKASEGARLRTQAVHLTSTVLRLRTKNLSVILGKMCVGRTCDLCVSLTIVSPQMLITLISIKITFLYFLFLKR